MMDIHAVVKSMARAEAADAGQLTLGALIEKLAACDPTATCDIDTGDAPSTSLTSHRGYYDHLAIEPDQNEVSVEVVLHCLQEAVLSTHEGYKGGRFLMDKQTPVWIAHWGATGVRIVGVDDDGARVVIVTEQLKE